MSADNNAKLVQFVITQITNEAATFNLQALAATVNAIFRAYWSISDDSQLQQHLEQMAKEKGPVLMSKALEILHATLDKAKELQVDMWKPETMVAITEGLAVFRAKRSIEGESGFSPN